jgi:hypothetical protein
MIKYNPPALSESTSTNDTLHHTGKTIRPDSLADNSREIADSLAGETRYNVYTSAGVFYIIIESGTNREQSVKDAEKLKKELRANIFVLPPSKEGVYRISYGKYATIEEARTSLKKIRSLSVSNAWIYSENK